MTNHTAVAEFSSALPVGTYKVEAKAIDDLGLESSLTSQLTFYVTAQVQLDVSLLWDVKLDVPVDVTLVWEVIVNGQKDISLLWNIDVGLQKDLTLIWNTFPVWVDEPFEDASPVTTWTEVFT